MSARLQLSALLCCILLPVTSLPAQIGSRCGVEAADSSVIDFSHPKYFTNVTEVTSGGERIPVFVAMSKDVAAPRRATRAVDRTSLLEVTFDRKWILEHAVEGDIRINGRLNDKPIEIPGYSLVGQQERTGSVRLRSATDLFALLCNLGRGTTSMGESLAHVEQEIRDAENHALKQSDALEEVITSIRRHESSLASVEQRLSLNAGDSTLAHHADSLRALVAEERRDEEYLTSVVGAYSGHVLPDLSSSLDRLKLALVHVSDPENRAFISIVGRRTGRNGSDITATATQLRTVWIDSLARLIRSPDKGSTGYLTEAREAVETVRGSLRELDNVARDYFLAMSAQKVRGEPALLRDLKDTEVLLTRVGAEPRHRMVLSVSTGHDTTRLTRDLNLDMRVARLGWTYDVVDSFQFLRRLSASYERSPANVSRAEATLQPGRDTVIEVPVGVNYDLTPGASLIWTHYDRGRLHWLQPSFGLNISFPKFQTKTYTLSRPAGEAGQPVSRKEETTGNSFDLAVGGLVAVFDGAVGVTVGRNLMVQDKPWYWGLNLSFLRLAKNAAKIFPSST